MSSLTDTDPGDLVARIIAGDQDAWVALTDRYTNVLWSVARGMRLSMADSADAVQTTWLRLVERIDTLREPQHLGSWLVTTVRRESLAMLRRGAHTRPAQSEEWEDIPAAGDPLDEALVREERDVALWKAFNALSVRCQALLRMLIADPAPSYAEVSAAFGVAVGSIGPTRQRCLNALRKIMTSGAEASDISPCST
jgi:RNA polymerase sigma factor (sigma-70 family)